MSSLVPLLSFRGLSLRTTAMPVLSQVSFDVRPGEVVAVVGESGSGKTMAARAAIQLLPSAIKRTEGEVLFEGRNVLDFSQQEISLLRGKEIGMIFQEPMVSLNPAITVGSQLIEGLLLHDKISKSEAVAKAEEMLAKVQIADPGKCMRSFPHQFSGGMRQRIMIASVMLLKPKLVIADEPTTALDTLTQREVLKVMLDVTQKAGTAVMLITHNLGLVAQYADSVVVLERGVVVEAGAVGKVLRQPEKPYTRKLIDALPKRDDTRGPVPENPPLIEARNLFVTFPGRRSMFGSTSETRAVDGVSLSIKPGEVVSIVGGSGSGKTTFGRALIGLLPITGGEVLFRGKSMQSVSPKEERDFRLNCQLVFQDPYSSLDPRQQIGAIVEEPLKHGQKMTAAEKRDRVKEILEEVGLSGLADRYPHALSGGQRQRVAIARAVIRNPSFVVADEPVSALDMTIQKQVLELFRRLQERHGFACLFISHDLGAVSQISDRVFVMKSGKVVDSGSVAEVYDRPKHQYTRDLLAATPTLAAAALVRDNGLSARHGTA
jgi:peptide/nickel transport system ATP-binding protein